MVPFSCRVSWLELSKRALSFRKPIIFLLLLASFCVNFSNALPVSADTRFNDAQVKAALLFSFFRFVDWPQSFDNAGKASLSLGIIGEDSIGEHLQVLVGRKWAGGRKIVVSHFNSVEDLQYTNILFIANSAVKDLPKILEHIKGEAVLTVGDNKDFIRDGGMITFVGRDNKVRFEIDQTNAKRQGIYISDELLKLADTVY